MMFIFQIILYGMYAMLGLTGLQKPDVPDFGNQYFLTNSFIEIHTKVFYSSSWKIPGPAEYIMQCSSKHLYKNTS